jgi:hypothetical protein
MSILGKILAFVNILGAVGLLALVSVDFAKRQAWAHDDFMYQLRIDGLLLDDGIKDLEGQSIAGKIGPQTGADLFGQSAGEPVTTQKAEVERVQQQLTSAIQAASDPVAQAALYARALLPLARTNSRRQYLRSVYLRQAHFAQAYQLAVQPARGQAMQPVDQAFAANLAALQGQPNDPLAAAFFQALRADPRKPFDQLFAQAVQAQQAALEKERAQLDSEFKQVFQDALKGTRTAPGSGEQGGQPVQVAPPERRREIANLLFNMTEVLAEDELDRSQELAGVAKGSYAYVRAVLDSPAYRKAHERFLIVVGLKMAVAQMEEEALVLDQIGSELSLERARERNAFALSYQTLITQLQDRAADLEAHQSQLGREQKQLADQQELVKRRLQDVKRYQNDLAESRQATAERVKKVQDMSQQLYEIRLQVRDALAQNQQYVRDIRKLEQGR